MPWVGAGSGHKTKVMGGHMDSSLWQWRSVRKQVGHGCAKSVRCISSNDCCCPIHPCSAQPAGAQVDE